MVPVIERGSGGVAEISTRSPSPAEHAGSAERAGSAGAPCTGASEPGGQWGSGACAAADGSAPPSPRGARPASSAVVDRSVPPHGCGRSLRSTPGGRPGASPCRTACSLAPRSSAAPAARVRRSCRSTRWPTADGGAQPAEAWCRSELTANASEFRCGACDRAWFRRGGRDFDAFAVTSGARGPARRTGPPGRTAHGAAQPRRGAGRGLTANAKMRGRYGIWSVAGRPSVRPHPAAIQPQAASRLPW